jgi:hypothetical protein
MGVLARVAHDPYGIVAVADRAPVERLLHTVIRRRLADGCPCSSVA